VSTPSLTKFLANRQTLPIGVHPFSLSLRSAQAASIQWIVHAPAPGATATIALYLAATGTTDDLADLDPATNPFWSILETMAGVPITFPRLPAAVLASCLLPLSPLSVSGLLAVVTVAGGPYPSFSLLSRITG
jgi:hypothetical protein